MIQFRDAKRAADARTLKAATTRWAKNLALIAIGVFVLLFAYGSYIKFDAAQRTPDMVARIHARTVTMDMVEGRNLPPMPSESEKDATVAGVDINQNGVRDDVEIEIFKRHPNEPKVRAAQLQYAMALQSQLTEVFSEGTLVASIQESDRAEGCIRDVHLRRNEGLPKNISLDYEWTEKEIELGNKYSKEHDEKVEPIITEVRGLVLNSQARIATLNAGYKFMTGYGGTNKNARCDIDPNNL
ncbi:MAG: hypothetical protein KBE09_04945 [Candidatus Pacebacteria bacterium]|nr:hypothetical protein [Candidatus Paceibacterota bacterium]